MSRREMLTLLVFVPAAVLTALKPELLCWIAR
jgi:hypothetical protein